MSERLCVVGAGSAVSARGLMTRADVANFESGGWLVTPCGSENKISVA